jgi:hypothetical protein
MSDREALASWMRANGFATGHGDTTEMLLTELTWQVAECRQRGRLASGRRPGICDRLRRGVQHPNVDEPYPAHWNIGGADKLMDGAADEIERLRAALWNISSFRPTDGEGDPHTQIAVHAKRTAAEALTKE